MSLVLAAALTASAALPSCSWDRPGRNPFVGELVRAVDRYQDIPSQVRARLKQRIGARRYDEIVVIRRDAILGRASYAPGIRDMHFGEGQVCGTVTRAKWTASDEQLGLVYCESGHCVMVPTVCRNLSRIHRLDERTAAAAQEEADVDQKKIAAAPTDGNGAGAGAGAGPGGGAAVAGAPGEGAVPPSSGELAFDPPAAGAPAEAQGGAAAQSPNFGGAAPIIGAAPISFSDGAAPAPGGGGSGSGGGSGGGTGTGTGTAGGDSGGSVVAPGSGSFPGGGGGGAGGGPGGGSIFDGLQPGLGPLPSDHLPALPLIPTPVPEPAAALLMLGGLGALGALLARRRRLLGVSPAIRPAQASRSQSDLGSVGCESTAAVHFSPSICPIAGLCGCKSGKNCPRWGRLSLSTPQVRQAPSPG